ncbi:hypothetical protein [Tessaracoccus aquimaris]|uniref:hypothetical protein n=1 Tax=Tessaracoccus aquimaris TaxID=1332264 RepID=UPI0011AB3382|nr:hypothetical protein [Tessaracoccus aquimaris]
MLDTLGYIDSDVTRQPASLAGELVKRNMYTVNATNLRYLTGLEGDNSLALDRVTTAQRAFIYENIAQYVGELRLCTGCYSISADAAVASIMNDISTLASAEPSGDDLDLLVSRLPTSIGLELSDLETMWWQAALHHGRVSVSWPGLAAYFRQFGELQAWEGLLATIEPHAVPLPTSGVTVPADLLIALLQLEGVDPTRKFGLLARSGTALDLGVIPSALDGLLPAMVAEGLIPDRQDVYARLKGQSIELQELIEVSADITDYLDPEVLDDEDFDAISSSNRRDLMEILLSAAKTRETIPPSSAERLLTYLEERNESVDSTTLLVVGRSLTHRNDLAPVIPALAINHSDSELLDLLAILHGQLEGIGRTPIKVDPGHLPLVTFLRDRRLVTSRSLVGGRVSVKPRA